MLHVVVVFRELVGEYFVFILNIKGLPGDMALGRHHYVGLLMTVGGGAHMVAVVCPTGTIHAGGPAAAACRGALPQLPGPAA